MSRNGSGIYSLPTGNPVVTGTTISSTWANSTLTDISTALTGSVAADGQTPITANLPMSSHKLTGLSAGSSNGDSVRYNEFSTVTKDQISAAATKSVAVGADLVAILDSAASNALKTSTVSSIVEKPIQSGASTLLGTVAGTDTITAVASPVFTSQVPEGALLKLPATGANAGATTLNVDGQGAVSVVRPDGTALQANDIPAAGYICLIEKRAADFVLLNPANLLAQQLLSLSPFFIKQFFPTY